MGWLGDLGLLTGEAVCVIRPTEGTDELGEPIEGEPTRETVENVLVTPGATQDMEASRPDGIEVAFTLGFPKTYTESLRGCFVEVRGNTYEVIGSPEAYTPENISGLWNLTVEAKRTDG